MAVKCTKCGRQYDVTLFQFGRTINCACGARVGLEHRLNLSTETEVKFFADVNVARLVRWLRAAGFDTLWEDRIADFDLVRRAAVEKRFVLTLDKRILQEFLVDHVVLLTSEDPLAQFAEIIERFNISKPVRLFVRCLACNTVLRPATTDEIGANVPEAVAATTREFQLCPTCGKIYWEGTHTRRMRAAIEEIYDR
jgi:uncharacterized protein with PIN domain/DNA-directed RNA polymerase subunit RPC12/RpoP